MNKIYQDFSEAVADIFDGASIAFYVWGSAGTPQNLLLALREQGAQDLTVITPNFLPQTVPEDIRVGPSILLPQMKKLIAPYYLSSVRMANVAETPSELAEAERKIVAEPLSHGLLVERLRAAAGGMGPFYCVQSGWQAHRFV